MLEKVPSIVGAALKGVRPGLEQLIGAKTFGDVPDTIVVESVAFGHGEAMPVDCSEDGRKVSPPLSWRNVPEGAAAVVILVADADSPTPAPLVHAIVLGLPGCDGQLAEGELKSVGSPGRPHSLGKNSFMKPEYLPLDPPSGHGPHRYAFQVFGLDAPLRLGPEPGRGEVVEAMAGHVLAKGVLIGAYERS